MYVVITTHARDTRPPPIRVYLPVGQPFELLNVPHNQHTHSSQKHTLPRRNVVRNSIPKRFPFSISASRVSRRRRHRVCFLLYALPSGVCGHRGNSNFHGINSILRPIYSRHSSRAEPLFGLGGGEIAFSNNSKTNVRTRAH